MVKVENKHANQVAVKRALFILYFSKCDESIDAGADSSVEVMHYTINTDK